MNQDRHEELARKLSAIEAPPPPEGLLDKLRGDIPDEFPVENRSAVRHFTGWSLGLAASILVMIGAAYFAVSYQKSAQYAIVTPEAPPSRVAVERKSKTTLPAASALPSATLEPRMIAAEAPKQNEEASARGQEQDLRKDTLARKRDEPIAVAPAKRQQTYAPETQPTAVAESREMADAAGGVEDEGGVAVGAVRSADRVDVAQSAAPQESAVAPQRAAAKSAGNVAAPPPAAPAPAQLRMKSEAYAPVRAGRAIPSPRVLRRVDPVVPGDAKKARAHGIVVLDVMIDAGGNVVRTTLLKGLPYGLNESVMDAVRQWKFAPTVIDGRAVPVIVEIPVEIGAE